MQFDTATGLYYDNARWYDPAMGRFIAQDPTGFTAGDADLYRYVANSPTFSIDPLGEAIKREWINLGGGWRYGIDRGPEVFGGFEIHVYKNGQEVAKIKGNGGYCKTHGGKELLSPSQLRKQYGDSVYKRLMQEITQRAKQAKSVGWTKGLCVTAVILNYLIGGYAEALNIASADDSAYRKLVEALSNGDIDAAQQYADDFYMELLTNGAGANVALRWKDAWATAVSEAVSDSK